MRRYGARSLTVTGAQAATKQRLIGGPVRLRGWSLNDGVASGATNVDQSAAAPLAGATVASVSLPNGVYAVQWFFELTGTPGPADADNVALLIGATQVDQSVNQGVVGNYGPFTTEVQVTGGPLTLAAKAGGNATAGTTYRVKIVATPVSNSTATVFDGGQAVGFASIDAGGADTHWFTGYGVEVLTELSVQTTLGTVQGVLWYELCYGDGE